MRSFCYYFVAVGGFCASAASAQAASLWQNFMEGDTPQAVSEKLAQLPEVRRAQVKGTADKPRVVIKYEGAGIEILGETYRIVPEFSDGRLKRMGIGTDVSCVTGVDQRYDRLVQAMASKYPHFIVGPRERSDRLKAMLKATEAQPVIVSTIMTNGETVALLAQEFTKKDPPPPTPYGATSSMRAAGRLLWSMYDQTAAECDGTGVNRVRFMISYMSKTEFDRQYETTRKAEERVISGASDKL